MSQLHHPYVYNQRKQSHHTEEIIPYIHVYCADIHSSQFMESA
jgi:hypothetical protein